MALLKGGGGGGWVVVDGWGYYSTKAVRKKTIKVLLLTRFFFLVLKVGVCLGKNCGSGQPKPAKLLVTTVSHHFSIEISIDTPNF